MLDMTRTIKPNREDICISVNTFFEKEIPIEDLLTAQKMTDKGACDMPYKATYIFNNYKINTERVRGGNADIRVAFADILHYGYLLGVRAEKEKRASKKANKKGME